MSRFGSLLGFACLVLSLGCGSGRDHTNDERNFHNHIQRNSTTAAESFPLEELAISANLKNNIATSGTLLDLFPLDHLIKLEFSDGAIIAYITQILYLDGFWFILDDQQDKIFKFSSEGAFIQTIGRAGEGPGEYTAPANMKHCFGNNIAVYDAGKGSILVYDVNGNFIFNSSPNSGDMRIIPGRGFVWPERDKLYLAAYSSLNPSAPWHVILDYSQDDYKVVHGFGERFEPFKLLKLGSWAFQSFEIINEKLWVGPSYFDYLEFYDLEGRRLGRSPDVKRGKKLVRDDFKNLDREKGSELFRKDHNTHLIQVGPIVIASMFWVRDLFDINGNLIRANMESGHLWPILESYSENGVHYGVSYLFPNDNNEYWDDKDFKALKDMGLDLQNIDNENPYLRIGRLNDQ